MSLDNIPREEYAKFHKQMPIVCIDCVVSCDSKILLVKRKCEPMKDSWWFPGGRLVRNENLAHAVRRIVKVETGLSFNRQIFLGFDETQFETDPFGHNGGTHTINFVYAAPISEMELMRIVLDDNHITHSLFSYKDIYNSEIHPYVKRFTALAEGVLRK